MFSNREMLFIVGLVGLIIYVLTNQADSAPPPKYQIAPAFGVMLRLDTQTGDVDICAPKSLPNTGEYISCE
jgi:hypothetical protein